MTNTFLYLIVAAFFAVALVPIKFMTSEDYKTSNRGLYLGAVVSFSLNLYFYLGLSLSDGVKRFETWHVLLTAYLPFILWVLLVIPRLIAKACLRGGTSMKKWGVAEAREVLLHEQDSFRRFLAYGFIAFNFPYLIIVGMTYIGILVDILLLGLH